MNSKVYSGKMNAVPHTLLVLLLLTACAPSQSLLMAQKIPMKSGESWTLTVSSAESGIINKLSFSSIASAKKAQKNNDGLYSVESNKLIFKSDSVNETWESVDLAFEKGNGAAFYFPQPNTSENSLVLFTDNSKNLAESSGCAFYGWPDDASEMIGQLLDNKNPRITNTSCKAAKEFR
jgi:hypothetical protein